MKKLILLAVMAIASMSMNAGYITRGVYAKITNPSPPEQNAEFMAYRNHPVQIHVRHECSNDESYSEIYIYEVSPLHNTIYHNIVNYATYGIESDLSKTYGVSQRIYARCTAYTVGGNAAAGFNIFYEGYEITN